MERHYFNPTPDTTYENKGGGSYICLAAEGQHSTSGHSRHTAVRCTMTVQSNGTVRPEVTSQRIEKWGLKPQNRRS